MYSLPMSELYEPRATLDAHRDYLKSIRFSPNGCYLATATSYEIAIWEVPTFTKAFVLTSKTGVGGSKGEVAGANGMAFSPDRRYLAAAGYRGVTLWEVGTFRLVCNIIVRDDELIPATAKRGIIPPQISVAYHLAFSPDSSLLAISWSDAIRIWSVAQRKFVHIQKIRLHQNSRALAFSADGRCLATGGEEEEDRPSHRKPGAAIHFFDIPAFKLVTTINKRGREVRGLTFSPDGKYLIAAIFGSNGLIVWPTGNLGRMPQALSGLMDAAFDVACTADGSLLATQNAGDSVGVWRFDEGRPALVQTIKQPHGSNTGTVSFSTNGAFLAAAMDQSVGVWSRPPAPMSEADILLADERDAFRRRLAGGSCLACGQPIGLIGKWRKTSYCRAHRA